MQSRISILSQVNLVESESGEELDLKGQDPKAPTKLVTKDTMLTTTPASLLMGQYAKSQILGMPGYNKATVQASEGREMSDEEMEIEDQLDAIKERL